MRYGDLVTGILGVDLSEGQLVAMAEGDLRGLDLSAFFPLGQTGLLHEEVNTFDPEVRFNFWEAIEFVYRVRRIRIVVDLSFEDADPINIDETQWMAPNVGGFPDPNGLGGEELIPAAAFEFLGRSLDGGTGAELFGTSLFIRSYKPSTQEFQMGFAYGTDLDHFGLTTSPEGDVQRVGAFLDIFGHLAGIYWPTVLGEDLPSVTGSVVVRAFDYRGNRDASEEDPVTDEVTGRQLLRPVPGGV